MQRLNILLLLFVVLQFVSCKAFKYGYTSDKAENTYHLVTGDKKMLADKRIDYIQNLYKKSELGNHLNCKCNDRGLPDFFYEYKKQDKCRGIKLFYVQRDSVFIFEEPKKNKLFAVLKEARPMTEKERYVHKQLKAGLEAREIYTAMQ
jgi:hypothetical protein